MLELALHILDIVENSVRAGADLVDIRIYEDTEKDKFSIEIADNGRGMDKDTLKKALDPFYTTKKVRDVGLGLPMLFQAARMAGGNFDIDSKEGRGTKVIAGFKRSHIDRQPLGDIASTLIALITGNPEVDFVYTHDKDSKEYILDTRDIRKALEDIPINDVEVLKFIRGNIREGLEEINKRDKLTPNE